MRSLITDVQTVTAMLSILIVILLGGLCLFVGKLFDVVKTRVTMTAVRRNNLELVGIALGIVYCVAFAILALMGRL